MKNHGKNSETILLNNTRFRYFLWAGVRDFTSDFTMGGTPLCEVLFRHKGSRGSLTKDTQSTFR